jgi:hypothetical protein
VRRERLRQAETEIETRDKRQRQGQGQTDGKPDKESSKHTDTVHVREL